jgi:hypothetical protein
VMTRKCYPNVTVICFVSVDLAHMKQKKIQKNQPSTEGSIRVVQKNEKKSVTLLLMVES